MKHVVSEWFGWIDCCFEKKKVCSVISNILIIRGQAHQIKNELRFVRSARLSLGSVWNQKRKFVGFECVVHICLTWIKKSEIVVKNKQNFWHFIGHTRIRLYDDCVYLYYDGKLSCIGFWRVYKWYGLCRWGI